MNLVRCVVLTALTCSASAGLAQTPAAHGKLSPDEILSLRVAECSTFGEGEEPDECVRLGNTTARAFLTDALAWLNVPWGMAPPPGGEA